MGGGQWWISGDTQMRIWQLDTGGAPIFVALEADTRTFDSWITRSQDWLDGIEFGAPIDRGPSANPTTGEFEVGRTEVVFIDSTRATDEISRNGEVVVEATDQRSIAVTLAYPAPISGSESDPASGAFPLVIAAHGLGGSDWISTEAEALVATGFVVAAIRFPESSAPGGSFRDFAEQPADVSFVLDRLLGDDGPSILDGVIDGENIGVVGRSLGGSTVYGLIGAACCRDERIDAAVSHAGLVLFFGDEDWRNPPTLIIGGQADEATRIETLREIAVDHRKSRVD